MDCAKKMFIFYFDASYIYSSSFQNSYNSWVLLLPVGNGFHHSHLKSLMRTGYFDSAVTIRRYYYPISICAIRILLRGKKKQTENRNLL
jgi:hypothetical protein